MQCSRTRRCLNRNLLIVMNKCSAYIADTTSATELAWHQRIPGDRQALLLEMVC